MSSREPSASWSRPVSDATRNAIAGLSQMLGHELEVTALRLRQIPIRQIRERFGGAQAPAVRVALEVSGAASGQMMLLYDRRLALAFVDLAMGIDVGTTEEMGELEESALGETGNITGAFFVNALADAMGIRLWISPPEVRVDRVGALLEPLERQVGTCADDPTLIECTFGLREHGITGTFLVLPSDDLCQVLSEQMIDVTVPPWQRERAG